MPNDWEEPTGEPSGTDQGRDGHVQGGAPADQMPQTTGGAPVTDDEKTWGALSHVSYFILGIVGAALILALHDQILGEESEFVRHHAKQALFWQIAALVLSIPTCGLAALIMMVWPVLGALAASRKEWYEYPIISDIAKDF